MKKFLVLFMTPHADMKAWMETDEAVRKEAEDKMKQDWDAWMLAHKDMIIEAAGVGQMTKVTKGSSVPGHNDIMLYCFVSGESTEAVAKTFEDHPHLGIPNAWMEVMECNVLPSME